MGGAVMLLIAATVGITYGWTPDGGRGVKYIIQIPSDQVEQVVRSGEIASRIPPEIQGHVSEVVVRVGNGSLPRVTPSHLARADYQSTEPPRDDRRISDPSNSMALNDRSPLPIPAMTSPTELSPIRNPDAATAMMKPAPQGGGMNLPGSLGSARTTTPRPSTNPTTNPTTNPASTNSTGNGFDFNLQQTARDVLGNAADAARNTINGAVDRTVNNDDPRSRLSRPNPANDSPNTKQSNVNQSSANVPRINQTNPLPRNTASASQSDQEWYDLRNGSRRRPSTDPIEANVASTNQDNSRSPSLFDNSNFGRLPGGLASNASQTNDPQVADPTRNSNTRNASTRQPNVQTDPRNEYGDSSRYGTDRNSGLNYDPKLTTADAQRLPTNGYSFDSHGYPIDRQGYRLNRFGQRIDHATRTTVATNENSNAYDSTNRYPAGSHLADANRNQPAYSTPSGHGSQYPVPAGQQNNGNPQLVQPPLAPTPGQTTANGTHPPSYGPDLNTNIPYGYPAANGSGTYPQFNDPRYNDPRFTHLVGNSSSTQNPNLPPGSGPIGDQTKQTGSPTRNVSNDEQRSSSEVTGVTTTDRYREALQNPDQVAAQPIFNGMLLLSVVTNAYLLFWLKNLRLQFRDTVAAKRSSNHAGSLAASA